MARCRTDCLERPLSQTFRRLGRLVVSYPFLFLLLPMMITAGLGTGFYFHPRKITADLEKQFAPLQGPAKADRAIIMKLFPTNDSVLFSEQRLCTEGTYASLIAVSATDNILTNKAFQELLLLDSAVRRLSVPDDQYHRQSFEALCTRTRETLCAPANPLLAVGRENASLTEMLNISYPLFQEKQFLGTCVGGISLKSAHTVRTAKALKLQYFLKEDAPEDQEQSVQWLQNFITSFPDLLKNLSLTTIQVSYFTSISQQQQLERNIQTAIPLFSLTFLMVMLFSIVSCLRFDCVRSKAWVAAFGVLSSGLAILASFGLLLYFRVPFFTSILDAPFFILGVGVDDMFILISSWQQTKVQSKVEDRMADTYAEAAVSITITTLTDVLAFYIGTMTPFQSVKSFCIYTGTALLFCYLYNITFFGAVLALNGKREEDNRHWLACKIVKEDAEPERSSMYNICCVGGAFNRTTGAEEEHPMTAFFKKYYGPFLTNNWSKFFVMLLYGGYLASGIYGCLQIQDGLDLQSLVSKNSYISHFYDMEKLYFSNYGPRVMVIITKQMFYWDPPIQNEIENCMESLESSSYVDKNLSQSWLRAYKTVFRNVDNEVNFIKHLANLFVFHPEFKQDIILHDKIIEASRFFIQTVNVTTTIDKKRMLSQLREVAKNCRIPIVLYHPAFIYFDQSNVIISSMIQNIIVATGVMLAFSLLLIPNPLCSLWVTFAIASIIAGVSGFMTYWGINLDSTSMISLIICTGFAVDFSAHISYAFVSSKKSNVNEKVIDALHSLGYPIVQGALSTMLGVVVLSATGSHVFRTFFKVLFLIILFGALHGLVFIPVFLTFFGLCSTPCSSTVKGGAFEEKKNKNNDTPNPGDLKCYEKEVKNTRPSEAGTVITIPSIINIEKLYSDYFYNMDKINFVQPKDGCCLWSSASPVHKKES
ncbi:patched domain-containing protein 3-like [Microcaecilia unicolor]|uniref:Patched domain-containing protein 3 n=1 Tax=Microcaecilia unicolor TaxID=1415580 RepID=A0A6P7XML6_9AMPH|nr:patched domain-containing protein 3-like [Microcaecilia unicolor]